MNNKNVQVVCRLLETSRYRRDTVKILVEISVNLV